MITHRQAPGRPAASSPRPTPEQDDDIPEPVDPNRFWRLRRAFLVAGMATWLPTYGIGTVVAFSAHSDNQPHATDWLFVPLVGPWLTLAAFRNRNPCEDGGSEPVPGCVELLILDGMLQAVGAALTTVALVLPRDRAPGRVSEMISPYVLRNGAGVLMAGTF